MISWIVASHDPTILHANLAATLQLVDADELIVVDNPASITAAYAEGQARASQPVRCYIHHDVRLLAPSRLRTQLVRACGAAGVGVVGVVGSRTATVPWWDGARCGSVVDARMGRLDFGVGGEAAYVDGLLLATAETVDWDLSYPGFHLYDHDACEQMRRRGLVNWCLSGGADLVEHNTAGAANVHRLEHWHDNVARFREKWRRGGDR